MDTGPQPKTTLTTEGRDVTAEGAGLGGRAGFKPQTARTARLRPASRLPLWEVIPFYREWEPEKVTLPLQNQEGAELGSPDHLSLHSRPFMCNDPTQGATSAQDVETTPAHDGTTIILSHVTSSTLLTPCL